MFKTEQWEQRCYCLLAIFSMYCYLHENYSIANTKYEYYLVEQFA